MSGMFGMKTRVKWLEQNEISIQVCFVFVGFFFGFVCLVFFFHNSRFKGYVRER